MVLLLAAGFCASAINGVAGGGSLVSFPALMLVGYPAVVANVSNTVALVPGYLGATGISLEQLAHQQRRRALVRGVRAGGLERSRAGGGGQHGGRRRGRDGGTPPSATVAPRGDGALRCRRRHPHARLSRPASDTRR